MDRQEFLRNRKNYIGASDAPIIMGVSPWKTLYQLWQDKLDLLPEQETTYAMQRGIELEPLARKLFIEKIGVDVQPRQIIHPDIPYMMANFDGISSDNSLAVEIKCPGKADHDKAKEGIIPDKYYPQLQHQIAVANLDEIHYFSYRDGEGICIVVPRDDKYVKQLYKKEAKFWEYVTEFTAPPLSNRDYVEKSSKDWLEAADKYVALKQKIKELEEECEIYKKTLIDLSEDQSCKGGCVTTQKVSKKGRVDYYKIPEMKGVDLEKYRKSPTFEWRVKCTNLSTD